MSRKGKKNRKPTYTAYAYRDDERPSVEDTPTEALLFRLISHLGVYCRAPIQDFFQLGQVQDAESGLPYIFRDNGGSVLAVGHLDTVFGEGVPMLFSKPYVVSGALDDRLGVWLI